MLRARRSLALGCGIAVLLAALALPARAQVDGETHTPGGNCPSGATPGYADAADWDTFFECNSSSQWQRGPYFFGTTSDTCDSNHEGMVRWNSSILNLQVCDGTAWQAIGNTSNSCGSLSGLSFTNITGAPVSTLETASPSATITFSGCSSALSVSVSGGGSPEISINGGAWTTGGSIYSGQTLDVRLTSSSSQSTMLTATVTVQTTSVNWTVTTNSDPCDGSPAVGTVCADGSIYAGITPDGDVPMYVTPCDSGLTGTQGSCSGTEVGEKWSYNDTIATGVNNNSTGKANTASLHADDGNADGPYSAADYCYTLNYLGHTDWYLPAYGELNVLYDNQTAIGGFCNCIYWNSTEANAGSVSCALDFGNGSCEGSGSAQKINAYPVRCARHN